MYALKLRRAVRNRRGQTMVLGTLGVLLISIMMLLTLNVGQAVHEKIRIQQLADAAAFSTATQEARVFNFLAYTNRANISSLVSAASLHGFMSMASAIPEMFNAARITFLMHAGIEFAMCATCCWPFCFSMCIHCYHGIKDLQAARNYGKSRNDYRDAVNDLDDQFKNTMKALDLHMFYISGAQKGLCIKVAAQILQDEITTELRDKYAPQAAGNEWLLRLKNAGTLGAAPGAIQGGSRGFSDVFERSETIQKFVPTMIANGTRWSKSFINEWFVSKRGMAEAFGFMHPKALIKLLTKDGKPAKGISFPISHEGQGRIIKEPGSPVGKITSNLMGPDANAVGAYDSGVIMSMGFICIFSMIPMFMTYQAYVSSGPDGGEHRHRDSCSGADGHKFRCLDLHMGPFACFTLFDADPDPAHNFGQPAAYAVIKQDMNVMAGGGKGTWEVDLETDGHGTITVDLKTSEGPIEVGIANNAYKMGDFAKGVAMSKALAYYHLPRYGSDGWKEHPNFFNPYWKAKLHPFRPVSLSAAGAEAAIILAAGGAASYAVALPGAPLP